MRTIAFQITGVSVVYSTVCSDADQRILHQSSASLAFVRGIYRWPVNSPHKGPVTRKMFPFDDAIMTALPVEFHSLRNLAGVSKTVLRRNRSRSNENIYCRCCQSTGGIFSLNIMLLISHTRRFELNPSVVDLVHNSPTTDTHRC